MQVLAVLGSSHLPSFLFDLTKRMLKIKLQTSRIQSNSVNSLMSKLNITVRLCTTLRLSHSAIGSSPVYKPYGQSMNVSQASWLSQRRTYVNVFSEFSKSVKRQIEENKDLQKDIKQLSNEQQKLNESDAMKNAKSAISATSAATNAAFKAVGRGVDATLNTTVVKATSDAIYYTAKGVADISQKVL